LLILLLIQLVMSALKYFLSVNRIESSSQINGLYALQPRIVNARYYERIDWAQESVVLLIISTAGDGERLVFLSQYNTV